VASRQEPPADVVSLRADGAVDRGGHLVLVDDVAKASATTTH
jgi:hypothetical protein